MHATSEHGALIEMHVARGWPAASHNDIFQNLLLPIEESTHLDNLKSNGRLRVIIGPKLGVLQDAIVDLLGLARSVVTES